MMSGQPIGTRGVGDDGDGITLYADQALAEGATPAVTVFWLHGLGDSADGGAGAFVPGGGGIEMPCEAWKVALRATHGCFNDTSNGVFGDTLAQNPHPACKTLKRDDHLGSNRMSS